MKLKHNLLSVWVGFMVIATGCGQVKMPEVTQNDGIARPTNLSRVAVNSGTLTGNWFSDCYSDSTLPGVRFRERLTVMGQASTRYVSAYGDSNCNSELYQMTFSSSFGVSSGDVMVENISQLSISPLQASGSDSLNQSQFCRKNTWVILNPETFGDPTSCGIARQRSSFLEIYGNKQMFSTRGNLVVRYVKQ